MDEKKGIVSRGSLHTWKPSSVFKSPFWVLLFAHPYELFTRW